MSRPERVATTTEHLATTAAAEALGALAGADVRLLDVDDVRDYLSQHDDVIPAVAEIGARLLEAMPTDVQVSLELYHDPEIDDEHLVFYVRAHEYPDSFMDVVRALDAEFIPLLEGKSEWVLVTTDFQPPG